MARTVWRALDTEGFHYDRNGVRVGRGAGAANVLSDGAIAYSEAEQTMPIDQGI